MKVITMWQPWCFFVAGGWKTTETRTHKRFRNLVGLTIGIHAGLTWDEDWENQAGEFMEDWQIEKTRKMLKLGGAIICTAYVKEFRKLTAWDSQDALIDCADTERYGLFLEKINVIEAIPCSGEVGAWNYPKQSKAQLKLSL